MKLYIKNKTSLFFVFLLMCIFLLSLNSGCKMTDEKTPVETDKETISEQRTISIVFEEPDLPLPKPERSKTSETQSENLPRIAIIIDDMGHHKKIGTQLLDLNLELTFSFLPSAPFTPELNAEAIRKNRDILVHLPMEAQDPAWDPGPNALYLGSPSEDIRSTVQTNLDSIQGAIGVNNHMGSRYTEDRESVHEMLKVLQNRNLFFIDSYTTIKSVAMDEARKMGIKTARRHVFLDNIHTEADICRQLEKLIISAQQQGWAIGIGHPNKETLLALTRCKTDLFKQVRLVGVHELVE